MRYAILFAAVACTVVLAGCGSEDATPTGVAADETRFGLADRTGMPSCISLNDYDEWFPPGNPYYQCETTVQTAPELNLFFCPAGDHKPFFDDWADRPRENYLVIGSCWEAPLCEGVNGQLVPASFLLSGALSGRGNVFTSPDDIGELGFVLGYEHLYYGYRVFATGWGRIEYWDLTYYWSDLIQPSSRQVYFPLEVRSVDLNGDGFVDILDLGLFVQDFNSPVYQTRSDFTMDGQVNLAEVGIFGEHYGHSAYSEPSEVEARELRREVEVLFTERGIRVPAP